MSPKYILAFVAIIFVSVFGFGYVTTRQPANPADTQTVAIGDQASVQTATTQTSSDDDGEDDDNPQSQPAPTTGSTGTQTSTYTMAQVKTHKSASNCWTVVSGKVYDLTAWINNHPGGPGPILLLCGADGTASFTAQHGGQARPANELAKFNIGTLVQ